MVSILQGSRGQEFTTTSVPGCASDTPDASRTLQPLRRRSASPLLQNSAPTRELRMSVELPLISRPVTDRPQLQYSMRLCSSDTVPPAKESPTRHPRTRLLVMWTMLPMWAATSIPTPAASMRQRSTEQPPAMTIAGACVMLSDRRRNTTDWSPRMAAITIPSSPMNRATPSRASGPSMCRERSITRGVVSNSTCPASTTMCVPSGAASTASARDPHSGEGTSHTSTSGRPSAQSSKFPASDRHSKKRSASIERSSVLSATMVSGHENTLKSTTDSNAHEDRS
mmetsp:Transcript_23697/g.62378  ORF Transcript_23697/g.62378 Transcript_23697/m.62378 type:complete len:283 (+) Transcript_23697:266-1114(+)